MSSKTWRRARPAAKGERREFYGGEMESLRNLERKKQGRIKRQERKERESVKLL